MARKKRGMNRRKPSRFPIKAVVGVLVVIAVGLAGIVLLNQYLAHNGSTKRAPGAGPAVYLPLPPRQEVQQTMSSVSAPAGKPTSAAGPALHHPKGPGTVAIIIDDMGASMQELQALESIKLPLTFSVIPSLAHAKGVAEAAHGAGYQVMVHMPMEPEGYPKQPMEKIGLLVSMDNAEIAHRVESYFRTVPFAIGANNHMGSRFTQNSEKMTAALNVLKGKDLFFIDSKTSPASVGYRTARSLGLKCAERQVFLDNVQEEGAIRKQLAEAASIARRHGSAIAICHPHPATIRTLQSAMPELARSGITFINVSRLVK